MKINLNACKNQCRECACSSPKAEMRFDPQGDRIDFYLQDNTWIYDLDLNKFRDPKEVLDWIRQIAQKKWASSQMISQICSWALEGMENAR